MVVDKKHCDMCNEEKRNVTMQPSRSQLLFGGFRATTENRCPACERKVVAWINRTLTRGE